MTNGINADGIPRYKEPTFDELYVDTEPDRGSCWNCKHKLECKVLGLRRTFCALGHHEDGDDEIEHITMLITECSHWVHFEA